MKILNRFALALIVAQLAGSALAQDSSEPVPERGYKLNLLFSPYTYHFTSDSEHKPVVMFGLDREYPDGKLDGIALFSNSFGQPSVFIYPWGGVYHDIAGIQPLSFKWTAGLLYGYVGQYQDKVPLNYKGFSPGVILSMAYEFRPGWSGQLNLLGTAGLMFQINVPLN